VDFSLHRRRLVAVRRLATGRGSRRPAILGAQASRGKRVALPVGMSRWSPRPPKQPCCIADVKIVAGDVRIAA
jgi:hypothetical protein